LWNDDPASMPTIISACFAEPVHEEINRELELLHVELYKRVLHLILICFGDSYHLVSTELPSFIKKFLPICNLHQGAEKKVAIPYKMCHYYQRSEEFGRRSIKK
jgi:hypothetical protein